MKEIYQSNNIVFLPQSMAPLLCSFQKTWLTFKWISINPISFPIVNRSPGCTELIYIHVYNMNWIYSYRKFHNNSFHCQYSWTLDTVRMAEFLVTDCMTINWSRMKTTWFGMQVQSRKNRIINKIVMHKFPCYWIERSKML